MQTSLSCPISGSGIAVAPDPFSALGPSVAACFVKPGCKSLDELVENKLRSRGIQVRVENFEQPKQPEQIEREFIQDLDSLSKRERHILAYLINHNMRVFTCVADGGHANTLIARGIIRHALKPGQIFDAEDMPVEIPRKLWRTLQGMKDQFLYEPVDNEPYPWRVHWMAR